MPFQKVQGTCENTWESEVSCCVQDTTWDLLFLKSGCEESSKRCYSIQQAKNRNIFHAMPRRLGSFLQVSRG
uniref:Uncharacterized protein n=1 Tax=Macaca fascicularis TaxID=9541 RepID=Q9GMJ9_MACFA|nr:hypothetical protein [Macaca fascicularis]